jgi:hypothetical protein
MTTETQRLELLGWKALDEGRNEDGRYCVLAESCGHIIISFAPTRNDSWSAVCDLALRLTMKGELRLPFRR